MINFFILQKQIQCIYLSTKKKILAVYIHGIIRYRIKKNIYTMKKGFNKSIFLYISPLDLYRKKFQSIWFHAGAAHCCCCQSTFDAVLFECGHSPFFLSLFPSHLQNYTVISRLLYIEGSINAIRDVSISDLQRLRGIILCDWVWPGNYRGWMLYI